MNKLYLYIYTHTVAYYYVYSLVIVQHRHNADAHFVLCTIILHHTVNAYTLYSCILTNNNTHIYVRITTTTDWTVALDGVKLDGASYSDVLTADGKSTDAKFAIIDSGTSLLAGPTAQIEAMAAQLGAFKFVNGEWLIPCMLKLPPLTFVIGGKDYTLEGDEYVINAGNGICLLALMGIDVPAGPLFILGDTFMRSKLY
jgi:Eukaryotic aspartyl protease